VGRPVRFARLLAVGGVALLALAAFGRAGADETAPPAPSAAGEDAAGPIAPPVLRVELFGDSLTWEARRYLPSVATAARVAVEQRSFPGVALCDWFDELWAQVPSRRPDVVVLAFYGNSFTDCMRDGRGGWLDGAAKAAKYERDAEAAVAIAAAADAQVVLVGAPRARDQMLDPGWERVRDAFRRVASRHPGRVTFADAGAAIAPDGEYRDTAPCLPREEGMVEHDGHRPCRDGRATVRAPDGLHFCPGTVAPAFAGWPECPRYMPGAYRFAHALVDAARIAAPS
jgi:hypothetical protein